MLKINIDLHPFGARGGRRVGTLTVWNDGTNKQHPYYGNYGYRISDIPRGSDVLEVFAEGGLKEFKRSLGYWSLVSEILKAVGVRLKWDDPED